MKYHIVAMVIKQREVNAIELQKILTRYGYLIKTRLGIHETRFERDHGLIILHAEGSDEELEEFLNALKEKGIEAKLMTLEA